MRIVWATLKGKFQLKLGEKMDVVGFAVKGNTSFFEGRMLVELVVHALGMNKVHQPTYYKYPVDGAGGVGFTYIQPISESFVALDSWPDHKGAYLVICSCKPVDVNLVKKVLGQEGYTIKKSFNTEMGLK